MELIEMSLTLLLDPQNFSGWYSDEIQKQKDLDWISVCGKMINIIIAESIWH